MSKNLQSIKDIRGIREAFPVLQRRVKDHPLVYLDSAATTLKPDSVVRSVKKHYLMGAANVHRGIHTLSEEATQDYEEARNTVKTFVGARSRKEIVFTSGTTDSINLVANTFGRKNFSDGDNIVLSHMEHHSNIVPWQLLREQVDFDIRVLPVLDNGELDIDQLPNLLDERTKLVSVVYHSNALGTINPVDDIIKLAHERGVPVLLDCAQTVSHMPIDVQQLDVDFVAFSGHKMFGPTGIGVLYAKERHLEQMPPYKGGGDMISSVRFEGTTYNALPYKFEAGTPHIAGAIGLAEAIRFIKKVGWEAIQRHDEGLLRYGVKKLEAVDGLRLVGTARNKTCILSFVLVGIHPHDLSSVLDGVGVAIRAGHHCTEPLMNLLGLGATARASLSLYNTTDDLDALVGGIESAKKLFSSYAT